MDKYQDFYSNTKIINYKLFKKTRTLSTLSDINLRVLELESPLGVGFIIPFLILFNPSVSLS